MFGKYSLGEKIIFKNRIYIVIGINDRFIIITKFYENGYFPKLIITKDIWGFDEEKIKKI